jgi:ribonuclease III
MQMKNFLDYKFKNIDFLQKALSHRSVGSESNERLEFLGDAILNLVIAEALFHLHPDLQEGELSRLRAYLVNGELLADLAKELHLGEHIRLGAGEIKSGGSNRNSILADAVEAIIGAIFLDGGMEAAREQILLWYKDRLTKLPVIDSKDSKTKLQELLQSRKLPLPNYQLIDTKGVAHKQIFFIECRVNGLELVAVGSGTTKRKAEQNAADLFLQKFKEIKEVKI